MTLALSRPLGGRCNPTLSPAPRAPGKACLRISSQPSGAVPAPTAAKFPTPHPRCQARGAAALRVGRFLKSSARRIPPPPAATFCPGARTPRHARGAATGSPSGHMGLSPGASLDRTWKNPRRTEVTLPLGTKLPEGTRQVCVAAERSAGLPPTPQQGPRDPHPPPPRRALPRAAVPGAPLDPRGARPHQPRRGPPARARAGATQVRERGVCLRLAEEEEDSGMIGTCGWNPPKYHWSWC